MGIDVPSQFGVLILIILAYIWRRLTNQRQPSRGDVVWRQLEVICLNDVPIWGAYLPTPGNRRIQSDRVHAPSIPQHHPNTTKGSDLSYVPPRLFESWISRDQVGMGADHPCGIRSHEAMSRSSRPGLFDFGIGVWDGRWAPGWIVIMVSREL